LIPAKKHLGQHFLRDENIAQKIVDSFLKCDPTSSVLEIGPGTGALTKHLLKESSINLYVSEIDNEAVQLLKDQYPQLAANILHQDFLRIDLKKFITEQQINKLAIIGNFPYKISSQILFRVFEYRQFIPKVVGMFQMEVAKRIASPPGNKTYGILSVLIQAFYEVEYLFTVSPHVFVPPPKVKSGVLRLIRNKTESLPCNEKLFIRIVKAGFNQRRKTLRNALKPLPEVKNINDHEVLSKRAEQLSVEQFVELTQLIEKKY